MKVTAPRQVIHDLERMLERERARLSDLEVSAAMVPIQREHVAELEVAIAVLAALPEASE